MSNLTPTALSCLLPILQGDQMQASERRHFPPATLVFSEGDPCRGFPVVLSGTISVSRHLANGRRIELYQVDANSSCVLSVASLLEGCPYTATGITESAVDIILIPSVRVHEMIQQDAEFRAYLFKNFAERLTSLMVLIEEILGQKLDQRLADVLLRDGPIIKATHQKLADELGTVREVISRLLADFSRHGWISLQRGRIELLHPTALANLVKRGSN